jgi:hypothetical protein
MEKLKRRIAVFVVLIVVMVSVSLYVFNVFQNSSQNTVSNAQLNNVGYLGESNLFLISANVSYGIYSANMPWTGGTFDDQDCFVITATIRSDYTLEQLQPFDTLPDSTGHNGQVHFAVSATLYDRDSQVSANDVTGAIIGYITPMLGCPQRALRCGETDTIEIYMTANDKNIDNYTINLVILDLAGHPIP